MLTKAEMPFTNKHWRWFIPGHLWALPFTLGYAIFAFVFYRARDWGFRNGVLIAIAGKPMIGNPAGQTIGAMTCFSGPLMCANKPLRGHENTHIVELFVCGLIGLAVTPIVVAALGGDPLLGLGLGGFIGAASYSLVYGAVFLYYLATKQKDEKPGWRDDYRRNFLEVTAYNTQAEYAASTDIGKA